MIHLNKMGHHSITILSAFHITKVFSTHRLWDYRNNKSFLASEFGYKSTGVLQTLSCSDVAFLSGFVWTDSLTACAVSYSESLKGNTKTGAGLKIQNTCTHFHCWLCGVVLSIFTHLKHFAASDLSSLGCSRVVSLFNQEEQRKVGSWCNKHCCHTCWPCSW